MRAEPRHTTASSTTLPAHGVRRPGATVATNCPTCRTAGCPGLGVTKAGPYWLDGRNELHVTDITLPEPGRVTIAGDAPREWEIVLHRADVDLRIVTGAPFAGPHLLREGDYTLLWRDAAGDVQRRPFRVQAGDDLTVFR